MVVNKEEVIKIFNLKPSGQKGWYVANYPCPFCGKGDYHFAIIFSKKISSFKCQKCKEHGTLWKLLRKVKRLDLLDATKTVNQSLFLQNKLVFEEKLDIDYSLPCKAVPLGFNRSHGNKYLKSRGFTKEQFKLFHVGTTKIHPILKNGYVVILIREDEEYKGYIGRSTLGKKTIQLSNDSTKLVNKARKERGEEPLSLYLRYTNSPNTDFGKMLFGYEELNENTDTVIAVEGPFDKWNVDRLLDLYSTDEIKCNATFGNSISNNQIKRWIDKKIKNIILLYDSDWINLNKECAVKLAKFFNVEVGFTSKDKDPGELNIVELMEILNNLEDPVSYNISKIQKNKLL